MSVYPVDPVSPSEILARLPASFAKAKQDKDIFHFDSTTKVVPGAQNFNVTICPALGEKMKEAGAHPSQNEPETKRARTTEAPERPSPFRPPYVPGLYVGCVEGVDGEENMTVLLNKFAVLERHCLLCPSVEQPQNVPPTPGQIARVYSLLQAGQRASPPQRLFAFYNGGPGAGASQRWRHVQFIEGPVPVEDWCSNLTFERNDRAIIHPSLPYLHIIHPMPRLAPSPTPDDLTDFADRIAPAIMRSFDLAFDALRRSGGDRSQGWNLLMTTEHIHLIPRSAPQYPLGNGHGMLELNALGYAGLLLVRSQKEDEQLDKVRASLPGGLIDILAKCAISREYGEQALQAENDQHGGAGALDGKIGATKSKM